MRLLYAAIAYAAFVLSSAWAVRFLAATIDAPARRPAAAALAIDGALLLVFALHHSIAARDPVKRHIPPAIERSTYVLVASLLLFAVLGWWEPVPATIWRVGAPWSAALWVVYAAGWLIVAGSTFMVDHAGFFGLTRPREGGVSRRWMYNWCRHPMMLGLLIAFWATPHMSAGHLFFAVASSAYIGIGIRFEERSMRARFGAAYEEYARQVPALVPWRRPQESAGSVRAGSRSAPR
ncbi:methyltransferase family protein [Dactylosporangium sp. CA-139066]|uniref:methyltransferase family protein n=1 Tax=Dactylosporangium sp. CA-139066 TaxID=3239930 RepID=UPI003D8BC20A